MHRPALFAALACIPFAAGASAATRHLAGPGTGLSIDNPCAREITVMPDAPQGAGVTVDATADNQDELDRLRLAGGAAAKLGVADRCWRPTFSLSFEPTLVLAIHLPAGAALGIEDGGHAAYKIGDLGGPLSLDLSGAAEVKSGSVAALKLDVSGSADISVRSVRGPLQADLTGSGGLSVTHASVSAAALELSGRGSVSIVDGTIATLSLQSSGVAEVDIGATVSDAAIDLSGVGSVKIARVTGNLQKDVSGVGSVVVGNR